MPARERAASGLRRVAEAPLVVRRRGERAELGPQSPRPLEEEPAVGRHRLVLAEEVLEHREPGALRVRSLSDLRQLVRVAEQHERASGRADREHVGEGELPRLVDEEHVERAFGRVDVDRLAGERPRGAGDELVRRVGADVRILRRLDRRDRRRRLLLVRLSRAAGAAEREALVVRLVLDRAEHVVDRLVAQRGDADPLAGLHQGDRHLRAAPRLPGAGRPLDEEVALPERAHRRDGVGLEPHLGRAALEQCRERRIRLELPVRIRAREAEERLALHLVADRAAGCQSERQRLFHPLDAAVERHDAVVVVDLDAKRLLGARVEGPAGQLVLLRREGEAVGVALSLDLRRRAVPAKPADRGAVADQLVLVELRPAEPRPPLRPRLALVVLDEVAEETPRVALLGAR